MMKVRLGAAAFALIALGAPALAGNGRLGASQAVTTTYRYTYQTRHYYVERHHDRYVYSYSAAPRWHTDGSERRASYNAGFNAGAEAQWRIAYRRWAYAYAAYRQWRGPTGIFAQAGIGDGLHSGSRCDCE